MNAHEPAHEELGGEQAPSSNQAPADIEPEVNPDSLKRQHERLPDASHAATHFDAGTGQGTVTGPPHDGPLQERPILDGSTQDKVAEASVPNPNRGESDPAQMKNQPALNSTNTNRWLFAAVTAATIMTITLLLLMPWNPVWCGIGITVALVGVLAMLAIRASRIGVRARLRIDAMLMAIVWLVPLAIFIAVLLTSADAIWNRVT